MLTIDELCEAATCNICDAVRAAAFVISYVSRAVLAASGVLRDTHVFTHALGFAMLQLFEHTRPV